jgi:hypothetical protein
LLERWPSASPGARYVELDGAHGVTIQRSAEVNQQLRDHFSRVAL